MDVPSGRPVGLRRALRVSGRPPKYGLDYLPDWQGELLLTTVAFLARGDEACLLDAFDLCHTTVMNGDLHRSIAKTGHIFTNDLEPLGFLTFRLGTLRGDGCHLIPD